MHGVASHDGARRRRRRPQEERRSRLEVAKKTDGSGVMFRQRRGWRRPQEERKLAEVLPKLAREVCDGGGCSGDCWGDKVGLQ